MRTTSNVENILANTSETYLNNTMQIAAFNIQSSDTIFGINVNKVISFVRWGECTISGSLGGNSSIIGLLTTRGQTYPLVSLESWLGLPFNRHEYKNVILCEFNKQLIAFPVTTIHRIYNKSSDELETSEIMTGKVSFIAKIENEQKEGKIDLCLILDVETLIAEVLRQSDVSLESVKQSLNHHYTKTLLIAEDSKAAAAVFRKILDKVNINYRVFGNGKLLLDDLAKIDTNQIGLIISDIEMPEMDGFTLLKNVKEKYKTIPVIMNSSMSNSGVNEKVKTLGAEGFIAKTDPTTIVEMINKYCI